MGRTITFTSASARQMSSRLRNPVSRPYDSRLISRLLNRQIKSAMHTLLREVTSEVLEELEMDLKTRSKASWATSFCAISILCTCIEELQIAMNGFVMHMKLHGAEEDIPSVKDSVEVCQKLDDKPFIRLIELFHLVYQTRKLPSANKNVCNPLRDEHEIHGREGLDQESADLANASRQIIFDPSKHLLASLNIKLTIHSRRLD
jgi:hypothetical protein